MAMRRFDLTIDNETSDESLLRQVDHARLPSHVAINYGGRAEIVDVMRKLAREVAEGRLRPEEIDEQVIQEKLYTRALPDPDLVIRTSGETRVSNFLLWQIAYSEIHVTDTLWPD